MAHAYTRSLPRRAQLDPPARVPLVLLRGLQDNVHESGCIRSRSKRAQVVSGAAFVAVGLSVWRSPRSHRRTYRSLILRRCVTNAIADTTSARKSKVSFPPLPETFVPPGQDGTPGLYFNSESDTARQLADKLGALSSWECWYAAPWWLQQGDLMTIFAAKFREGEEVNYERHHIDALDGGVLALDLVRDVGGTPAARPAAGTPFGLLVSGLGGGSQDGYVRNMASALVRAGWSVGVLNMRGCGGSPVRTPRFFSAYRGSTDDVRVGIRYVRQLCGDEETPGQGAVALVGWSNGATIVANTLAEQTTGSGKGHGGHWTRADSGAILAAPYDMPRSTKNLEGELFPRLVYNRAVTKSLVRQFKSHMHLFRKGPAPRWSDDSCDVEVDVDLLMRAATIRDVDEAYTRKIFGYRSVDDYYYDASSIRRLAHVKVPLLMISAADDPMSTGWIPVENVRRNENLLLAYTAHGGHLGWQDAQNCSRSNWVEQAVVEFFDALLQKCREDEEGR